MPYYCLNQASGLVDDIQEMQELCDDWGKNYDTFGPDCFVNDDDDRNDEE